MYAVRVQWGTAHMLDVILDFTMNTSQVLNGTFYMITTFTVLVLDIYSCSELMYLHCIYT